MMHHFQQILELRESYKIITDIDKRSEDLPFGDVKSSLHTWRERWSDSFYPASSSVSISSSFFSSFSSLFRLCL